MRFITALIGVYMLGVITAAMLPDRVKDDFVLVDMNVSAYCPCEKCCGVYSDGQTANGYWIQEGDKLIAAPKTYAFGTVMDVPGYGKAEVKDRGGAIKGNKLDLYFDTHQEALNWGRQHLKVKVWR